MLFRSPRHHNENATFFMLATNSESDIKSAVQSVRELEDRFNRRYHYPWVFLNDEPFSDEFKRCVRARPSVPPSEASPCPDLTVHKSRVGSRVRARLFRADP